MKLLLCLAFLLAGCPNGVCMRNCVDACKPHAVLSVQCGGLAGDDRCECAP